MKGYFSSMMQQSGLRVAAPRVAQSTPVERPAIDDALPLEMEKRVEAESWPTRSPDDSMARVDPGRFAPRMPDRIVPNLESEEGGELRSIQRKPRHPGPDTRGAKTTYVKVRSSSQALEDTGLGVQEGAGEAGSPQSAAKDVQLSSSATEDSHDPGLRPEASRDEPLTVSSHPSSQRRESQSGEPAAHPGADLEEGGEHFSRTAEILEKPGSEKAEIQTVLIQDVQEWIAAPPVNRAVGMDVLALSDRPESSPREARTERRVVTMRESLLQERPEAGAAPEVLAKSEPMTQSFELSIGSIHVSIEEPAKPAPQASALPQPGRKVGGASGLSTFSRLSRSYL